MGENNISQAETYQKYIVISLTLLVVYFTYRLVSPFLTSIILAGIVGLALYPIYKYLLKKLRYKSVSSLILVALIVIFIAIPSLFLFNKFIDESLDIYYKTKSFSFDYANLNCTNHTAFCTQLNKFKTLSHDSDIGLYINIISTKFQNWIIDKSSSFVMHIPVIALQLVFFILFLFFFFRDGNKIYSYLKNIIPLTPKHRDHLIKITSTTLYSIIYGHFFVSIVQGVVGGIIFFILGIKSAIFWGVLMGIFALIPIGTWIIWLPASVYLIFMGVITESTSLLWKGLILFVLGLFVISSIDNFLKPILIGRRSKAHYVLVLIGLIGGLSAFGFAGMFLGPLILVIFLAILEMYKEMREENGIQNTIKRKKS